ncbi:MAG: hemolysin [Alphaproteobacteria bacterium]|jgi:hypothetical protein|nr:hemolysin [Alphaproteobacteria bacterium]
MPTSFEVLYLGNLPLIDNAEGDQFVGQAAVNSWLGTYGSASDPLASTENVKNWTADSFEGGLLNNAYDLDNSRSDDTFEVDGVQQTHDASMAFQATITYFDGTSASISAVVSQAENGDTYLMPEFSDNADQAKIEAGPIQSITLEAPIWASGDPGRAYNLVADRVAADLVPCFTPGTMIATPRGERPVEALAEGDLVCTRDNGLQEVRWAGRVDLDRAALAARPEWRPVRLRAGALGPDTPSRDLLLSPNHRMLITGDRAALHFGETEVLAAAKHLTGYAGVDRVGTAGISYIHLLFDRHEVILSNGGWSESFQPGDYSLNGIGAAQRDEIVALFPELELLTAETGWTAARKVLKRHEAGLLSL